MVRHDVPWLDNLGCGQVAEFNELGRRSGVKGLGERLEVRDFRETAAHV